MCKNCNNDGCIGFYLLHPSELHKEDALRDKHLKGNPNAKFEMITSPSSGEVFIRFKELHVIH